MKSRKMNIILDLAFIINWKKILKYVNLKIIIEMRTSYFLFYFDTFEAALFNSLFCWFVNIHHESSKFFSIELTNFVFFRTKFIVFLEPNLKNLNLELLEKLEYFEPNL